MFDEEGKLTAAVVGVGGFLGLGRKNVAVSWGQIDRVPTGAADEVELVTTLTRAQLEDAPEFRDLAAVQAEQEVATRGDTRPGGSALKGRPSRHRLLHKRRPRRRLRPVGRPAGEP